MCIIPPDKVFQCWRRVPQTFYVAMRLTTESGPDTLLSIFRVQQKCSQLLDLDHELFTRDFYILNKCLSHNVEFNCRLLGIELSFADWFIAAHSGN